MLRLTVMCAALVLTAGCEPPKPSTSPPKADEIRFNLAKLSPEDRALAEQQKLCAESNEPLGSMGVPIKVLVKGEPVFICCKSCEKGVQKDPDKTLAHVKELKEKNKK